MTSTVRRASWCRRPSREAPGTTLRSSSSHFTSTNSSGLTEQHYHTRPTPTNRHYYHTKRFDLQISSILLLVQESHFYYTTTTSSTIDNIPVCHLCSMTYVCFMYMALRFFFSILCLVHDSYLLDQRNQPISESPSLRLSKELEIRRNVHRFDLFLLCAFVI